MTPEEKRRRAFEDFDELLVQGQSVEAAIKRAAENNGLKPHILKTIAEETLGDLSRYAAQLQWRKVNDAICAEVRRAMAKRHPTNALADGYDADEVRASVEERIGRPMTEAELPRIEDIHGDLIRARVKDLLGKLT
jgi:hypothetical protein